MEKPFTSLKIRDQVIFCQDAVQFEFSSVVTSCKTR